MSHRANEMILTYRWGIDRYRSSDARQMRLKMGIGPCMVAAPCGTIAG